MGPANPVYRRLLSRVLVTMGPAALASGVAVYLLYAVNVARPPEQADEATLGSPQSDGLSTDERRELTRQMLKERRENPQVPAEVRPTPRQSDPAAADRTGAARPTEAKSRADRAAVASIPSPAAAAPAPASRTGAARTALDVPGPAMAAVGPTTPMPPPPPAAGDPTTLPPVAVNAAPEPERRGFAANMFSSISVLAGTAANATGNTVNWVIDLPGRAISAGGRLLVGNRGSSQAPANAAPAAAAPTAPGAAPQPAAPPAAAPPPKRNYL
jgi:hypothetical protein